MSPRKPKSFHPGLGVAANTSGPTTPSVSDLRETRNRTSPSGPAEGAEANSCRHECIRTTEEKKEMLGSMLGNVDALVDGVRKAGIWGLG